MKVQIRISSPQTPKYSGWRCLHNAEGGYLTPNGMPCVRPSENARPVDFTRDLQRLSYEINRHNPNFNEAKWRVVYAEKTAFTNGNGFMDDGDPRADYINGLDLNKELPKLMKAIVCAGFFTEAIEDGDNLICVPGIHAIDPNKTIPSVDEVIQKGWCFAATTAKIGIDGRWRVNNFPQGDGLPVYIPYVLRDTTPYPKAWFRKWDADYLPNHLTYYV